MGARSCTLEVLYPITFSHEPVDNKAVVVRAKRAACHLGDEARVKKYAALASPRVEAKIAACKQ